MDNMRRRLSIRLPQKKTPAANSEDRIADFGSANQPHCLLQLL
jgi:hypothetical protein